MEIIIIIIIIISLKFELTLRLKLNFTNNYELIIQPQERLSNMRKTLKVDVTQVLVHYRPAKNRHNIIKESHFYCTI